MDRHYVLTHTDPTSVNREQEPQRRPRSASAASGSVGDVSAENRGQEPADPTSGDSGMSSDDDIRELLLAGTDATPAPRRRRDALHLSAALIAVVAIMLAAVVALVIALPYLIQGGILLLFAVDPCQDWLNGCG